MSLPPDKRALYDRVRHRLEEAERAGFDERVRRANDGADDAYFGHDVQGALTRAQRREFEQLIRDAVLEKGCTSATGAFAVLAEALIASGKFKPAHVQNALQSESVAIAAQLPRRLATTGYVVRSY